ncbi:MAG: alanine racemase [Pseudomonadota bacterium]|jgi:alanine racemase
MVSSATAFLDLQALESNLALIRLAAPQSRIMAVIKANAYGHDAVTMAHALAGSGVDAFAVARLEEGLILRDAGIGLPVVVLQGFVEAHELHLMVRSGLEPVIHDVFQVDILEQQVLAGPVRVWLKLDTGMHRLGIEPEVFEQIRQRLASCVSVVQPSAVMTHLASADDMDNLATHQQLEAFHQRVSSHPARSVANSAGILGWHAAHTEWVRPGLALYGVSPFPHMSAESLGLRPVMTLRTRLIAVKQLQAGDRVGYGGDYVCREPVLMGIAAIGYGDGYPRQLPSGAPVLVSGQRCTLMGRVSMDMIAVNVTGLIDVRPGAVVTLWGDGLPVEEVARWADTIPYTLLCGIARRVQMKPSIELAAH